MVHIMRVRAVSSGWAGGPGLNTFYFQTATLASPVTADATAVVARVRAAFAAATNLWPNTWTLGVQSAVDVFDSATGNLVDSLTGTAVASLAGSNGATFGPLASGLCMNLRTLSFIAGRRVQGRAFLSPVAVLGDPDGTPQATFIAATDSIGAALIGGASPALELVVWHRPKLGAGGQACTVFGTLTRDSFSVLRSRRD